MVRDGPSVELRKKLKGINSDETRQTMYTSRLGGQREDEND